MTRSPWAWPPSTDDVSAKSTATPAHAGPSCPQAGRIIGRFGGISKMARAIGYPKTTVQRLMTPYEWRTKSRLSLAAAAELIGHKGQNPARTWQRWEVGERKCPADIIAKVEIASGGNVTAAAWAFVRQSWVDQQRRKALGVGQIREARP